ncbi:hypothetical protein ABFX02_05G025600 [Erythranthe guttata]
MDMSGNDTNVGPPKPSEDAVDYRVATLSNNVTNASIEMITSANRMVKSSSCSSSALMVDSFCPSVWEQQSLGYCDTSVRNGALLNALPHSLTHFPTDSAFIERAARFSCFSNGGSFSEMVNPLTILDPLNPRNRAVGPVVGPNEVFLGNGSNPLKDEKNGVDLGGNQSDGAEFSRSGEREVSNGNGSKKRKRIEKKNENNEAQQTCVETTEIRRNPRGKNGNLEPQGSDPPKEDYIHVRARRGQATNSHSLAERIRREKISERMKLLQDLVPGCSKVTGKAVMLDEIINYVQSLQRQVEFLSMKLATVNPRMDFNIEGLIAKDILQPRTGLSSSIPFPNDMTMLFPPFQPTVNVAGGFRQPSSQHMQAPSTAWEDEFHNVFRNGFNSSSPPTNSQDLSVTLPGHMKDEI